jgi:hypothetical protein
VQVREQPLEFLDMWDHLEGRLSFNKCSIYHAEKARSYLADCARRNPGLDVLSAEGP